MSWIHQRLERFVDWIEDHSAFLNAVWMILLMYAFAGTIFAFLKSKEIGYFSISNMIIWGSLLFMQILRAVRKEHWSSNSGLEKLLNHYRCRMIDLEMQLDALLWYNQKQKNKEDKNG